jgi:cyclophilin family peptidyl-prolyl cis-trans isomerase
MNKASVAFLALAIWAMSASPASDIVMGEVGPVPDELRASLKLEDYYQKYLDAGGLPVLGSAKLSDPALREAAWIVQRMLDGRADVLAAMAKNKVRLTVMAATEYTTDVPEHSHLEPQVYWDRRARGLGATRRVPCVSCAEENLLGFPGDPYSEENILIHEFAHAIHNTGLATLDSTFDARLQDAFEVAINRGLWKGTYAATNKGEYWAEGVQCWFDDNRENDAQHNHVNTRAELREYDAALAALCLEVFGDKPWRYRRPNERREAADRSHLGDWNSAQAPRFQWREVPIPEKPRLSITTAEGEIEIELDYRSAPRTVENFLKYVQQGFYNGGRFFGALKEDNQPDDSVKIAVVRAEPSSKHKGDAFPPIPLERTSETGIRHLNGTLSMTRDTAHSARHGFFICIGDQPELDFGGKANLDGQGFAAFGRVTKGLEIVKKIHAGATDGHEVRTPMPIQRVIRLN